MKDKYRNFKIGEDPDQDKILAIDEIYIPMGLVWEIETKSRKMRFYILPQRNSLNLKIFVNNHIKPWTTIVTDG